MSFRFTAGRAACGGQRYRISRSETENSLIIKHLTTQHSDIYVRFSTDDIQHDAVDKDNRFERVGEEVTSRRVSLSSLKTWIITHRRREDLKVDSGAFSAEEPLSIQTLSSRESHVSAMWLSFAYLNSLLNELL